MKPRYMCENQCIRNSATKRPFCNDISQKLREKLKLTNKLKYKK